MNRILVTGMSGTGRSSALAGLALRGYGIVDTDYYGDWTEMTPGAVDRLAALVDR